MLQLRYARNAVAKFARFTTMSELFSKALVFIGPIRDPRVVHVLVRVVQQLPQEILDQALALHLLLLKNNLPKK
jgi:hypothetical protein